MVASYLIPNWFVTFGIFMEILFGIVTLIVSYVSYKVYKIYKEKNLKELGLGFLFISISYILWALINVFLISKISDGLKGVNIENLEIIGTLGIYAYMFFFILGLVTLVYITFKSYKNEIYYLITGLSVISVLMSCNKILAFRIVSLILMLFVAFYYFKEYVLNKNKRACLVFIAFIFLIISTSLYIFSSTYYQAYVVGHIIELIAYTLVLTSLLKSLKK